MGVLYFDEAWDLERIQWEVDRLKAEITGAAFELRPKGDCL